MTVIKIDRIEVTPEMLRQFARIAARTAEALISQTPEAIDDFCAASSQLAKLVAEVLNDKQAETSMLTELILSNDSSYFLDEFGTDKAMTLFIATRFDWTPSSEGLTVRALTPRWRRSGDVRHAQAHSKFIGELAEHLIAQHAIPA